MNKLKSAIIGLGKIGLTYDFEKTRIHPSSHFLGYLQNSNYELVFSVDPNMEKEIEIKKITNNVQWFPTIQDAINNNKFKDIDVVSICTPPQCHMDNIRQIAYHTDVKFLFCEKPLVNSCFEYKELKKIIRERNVNIIPNISRRWSPGISRMRDVLISEELGKVKKIHVRYTRGIYNTGSHLFDLINYCLNSKIKKVIALSKTYTSSEPESSFTCFFINDNGSEGLIEAINDEYYYLFEIDFYLEKGKIEFRNSGDDVIIYKTKEHHLFEGFKELVEAYKISNIMEISNISIALQNIYNYVKGKEKIKCTVDDAIYPIRVAEAISESYINRDWMEVSND